MNAKLIVVGGKASKSEIALRLPTIIGRSRDADLTVAHAMVSRQHCELYEEGGVLKIRDLGSLNGTFVGKRQVREADLYPNDEFTVGPLTFRVKYRHAGAIASAPEPEVPAAFPMPGEVEPVTAEPAEVVPEVEETERQPAAGSPDVVEMNQAGAEPQRPASRPPAAAEGFQGIAPADGQLPDFSAWDARQTAQRGEDAGEEALLPGDEPSAEVVEGVLDDEGEPLLEPPAAPIGSEEESTAQFDALELPPGGELPGEDPPKVEPAIPPPPPPPESVDISYAEVEAEPNGAAGEDSADALPPSEPDLDEPELNPSDRSLDDFLKGLE